MMTELERAETLKELARGLKAACDAEDIAMLRQREARQRRQKYEHAINTMFTDQAAAYVFLMMLKAQAGCQIDDDFDPRVDGLDMSKPRVVR